MFCGMMPQVPSARLQHAPGQGFGSQRPGIQLPTQLPVVVGLHEPFTAQQAPMHGLGSHTPPRVYVPEQPSGPVSMHEAPRPMQHAPFGQGLGLHVPPRTKVPVGGHPSGPVIMHEPSIPLQHEPLGQVLGVQVPPTKNWPGNGHASGAVSWQDESMLLQHEPTGHGLGSHTAPGMNDVSGPMHPSSDVMEHEIADRLQHAPRGHGLGSQTVPRPGVEPGGQPGVPVPRLIGPGQISVHSPVVSLQQGTGGGHGLISHGTPMSHNPVLHPAAVVAVHD